MNDEDMDTYVFAVGTRKALVRLQKEMQDLVGIGALRYDSHLLRARIICGKRINTAQNVMQ